MSPTGVETFIWTRRMSALFWAVTFGCGIIFATFFVVYTTERAGRHARHLLPRRFSHEQVAHFFHAIRLWVIFLLLMGLGSYALTHRGSAATGVLALYVLATAIGAVSFVDWLFRGSR
jgi:hypothetical protein